MSCPSSQRIRDAYVHASSAISCFERFLTSTLAIMYGQEYLYILIKKSIRRFKFNVYRVSFQNNQLSEMKKKIEDYQIDMNNMLGSGSFGKVYTAQNIQLKEIVAVKIIQKKEISSQPYFLNALSREIQIMKCLSSPNIIKFHKFCQSATKFYLFQQLAQGGSLNQLLQQHKKFDQKNTIEFLTYIVKGFGELVFNGVIHRDIKPSNILINKGVLKIADFGFSIIPSNDKKMISKVGTPVYMSPQILCSDIYKKYTHKCDIWSIGLLTYELITGDIPWKKSLTSNRKKSFEEIKKFIEGGIQYPQNVTISDQLKSFIKGCLHIEQQNRFDWTTVFLHPIFEGKFKNKIVQNLNLLPPFVFSRLRMSIHSQNINLTKLFKDLPENLEMDTFIIILNIILPDIEEKEAKAIFQKIAPALKISKQKLMQSFTKYGISLKGRSVSQLTKGENEKEERIRGHLGRLEKIIQEKAIDLYTLFYKGKKSENQQTSPGQFEALLKEIDPTLEKQALKQLFHEFDYNNDGKISYVELQSKFCKLNQDVLIKNQKLMQTIRDIMFKGKYVNFNKSI